MERFLGIALLVGIPTYFLFVWWKHLLTLRRMILLIGLEVGVASTLFVPGKKGEWMGTAAGIVILSLYVAPAVMRWRSGKARPLHDPPSSGL